MAKFYKFSAVALVTALILFSPEVLAQRSSENPRAIEIWLFGPVLQLFGSYYFVATEYLGPRGTTAATSIAFYVNQKGDSYPDIVETPERRQFVDKMIAELTEEGWKLAGMGQYWYSYRFVEDRR